MVESERITETANFMVLRMMADEARLDREFALLELMKHRRGHDEGQ